MSCRGLGDGGTGAALRPGQFLFELLCPVCPQQEQRGCVRRLLCNDLRLVKSRQVELWGLLGIEGTPGEDSWIQSGSSPPAVDCPAPGRGLHSSGSESESKSVSPSESLSESLVSLSVSPGDVTIRWPRGLLLPGGRPLGLILIGS